MAEFMSPLEFLEKHEHKAFARYNSAKFNFETYGAEGPPVGTPVKMWFGGHGGLAGVIRSFGGPFKDGWKQHFHVLHVEEGGGIRASVILRETWWAEFEILQTQQLSSADRAMIDFIGRKRTS